MKAFHFKQPHQPWHEFIVAATRLATLYGDRFRFASEDAVNCWVHHRTTGNRAALRMAWLWLLRAEEAVNDS